MKKRNLFLMTLISIFFVGIACIFIGIAMGGTLFSFQVRSDGDENEYQTEAITLSPDEVKSIREIDWNIRTSDVKIETGSCYGISGPGRYQSYIKDGIWHIKTETKKIYITFLNSSIEIPHFWEDNWEEGTNKNTITIPSEAAFEKARIRVSAGELAGENLSADEISIKTGAGSCELEQLSAKDLSIKVGAGSSSFRKLHVSDSCSAKVGAGELTLGNKKGAANTNVIANLKGKCAAGSMTVTGKLTGDARLECSIGDIDMRLDGSRSNYKIDSHGSLGEIDIDDEDEDWDIWEDIDDTDGHDSHDSHKTEGTHPDLFGTLSLKCSLGDIAVQFQH